MPIPLDDDESSEQEDGESTSADMVFQSGTADLGQQPAGRQDGEPANGQNDKTAGSQDGQAAEGPLEQMLSAFFEDPPQVPAQPPDLDKRSNAYISAESRKAISRLQAALREAHDVKATQSMITELALRVVLNDAVENGQESFLVQWFRRQK